MSGIKAKGTPAENLFLEELWRNVFENVKNYEDLRSIESTCKLFQKLLLPTKKLWLFEEVLPLIFPYIDLQSVITCRKVCKTWNKAVDNSFDNEKLELESHLKDKRINSFQLAGRIPTGHIDLRSFTQIMTTHKKNLFIGHSIEVKITHSHQDNASIMWPQIYNFFQIFGMHIYCLKLHIEDHTFPHRNGLKTNLANFILNDLCLMAPNLKSLQFEGNIANSTRFQEPLQHDWTVSPHPLTNLSIIRKSILDPFILQRHSRTLKFLDCRSMLESTAHFEWPSLEELRFTAESLDDFKFLGEIKAPLLEKIDFYPTKHCKQQLPQLLKYLPLLAKSSPKFNHLKLNNIAFLAHYISISLESASLLGQLACPENENVKILEIEDPTGSMSTVHITFFFNHCVSNYFFLKAFTHVEKLKIVSLTGKYIRKDWYKRMFGLKEEVEVHKYLYYGRMYESNIWEVMPKLQTLTFKNRTYTRKRYEMLKNDV